MTIEQFDRAVQLASFKDGDRKWFPKWIRGYALFHNTSESEPLLLDRERVVAYLRHLRDKGTQAWQRKQAAKALQTYQNLLIRQELVQFQPILAKLDEAGWRAGDRRFSERNGADRPSLWRHAKCRAQQLVVLL